MLIARHVLWTILKTVEVPIGYNSEHYRILAPCANLRCVHQALRWVPIPMPMLMGFGWAWVRYYCSWVCMDEHGCDIIISIISNVTILNTLA